MSQHVQLFIITAEIFVPFPFHLRGTLLSFLPFNESWNIIMKRKGRGGRVSWRSSVKIMVTRSFSSSFILSLFFRFFFYPISLFFSLFSLFVALVSYFDTQSHFPFSLSLLFFFFLHPLARKFRWNSSLPSINLILDRIPRRCLQYQLCPRNRNGLWINLNIYDFSIAWKY